MVRLTDLLEENSDFPKILSEWNAENATKFAFGDIGYPQRKEIFALLLKKLHECKSKLSDVEAESDVKLGLESIRILSREKLALDECLSDENDVWLLIDLAYLRPSDTTIVRSVRMEAFKCLCNVIYNCPAVQVVCKNEQIVDALIRSIEHESDVQFALFASKILFLVTGFNAPMRSVAFKHGAVEALSKFITPKVQNKDVELDSLLSDCIIESLKALFNVASCVESYTDEDKLVFASLAQLIRHLLLVKSSKIHEICFQATAIMTVLPYSSYPVFVPISDKNNEKNDMEAIDRVLDHLEFVLDKQADNEHLVPILVALSRMARANRLIRRHLRDQVLPPLKASDVQRLPQEGVTIRNRLCRLLTSTSMELKEHTADFLFVLCKENVNRLIKYTGFGNAAGLLANRGLLGKSAGPHSNENGDGYSEDSEQSGSDTEEYRYVKSEVNPVTGRVDPPVSVNPFEGMSEEQKEYEAMQLVNAIDRLQRYGMINPIQLAGPNTLTTNGRHQPVESILQMRDEFLKHHDLAKNDDDDN